MKVNKAIILSLLCGMNFDAAAGYARRLQWGNPPMSIGQIERAIQYETNELNDPHCQQWFKDQINANLASLKIQLQIAKLEKGAQSEANSKQLRDLRKQVEIMALKNEIQDATHASNDPNCSPFLRAICRELLPSFKNQLQTVQNTP